MAEKREDVAVYCSEVDELSVNLDNEVKKVEIDELVEAYVMAKWYGSRPMEDIIMDMR